MADVSLNYWAILACVVASFVLGMVWYSAFSNVWMSALGKNKEDMQGKGANTSYAIALLGALVMATVMACFIGVTGADTISEGLQIGFWAWLGFIVPSHLVTNRFEGRSLSLYWLTIGHVLLEMLVFGAILTAWK